MSNFQIRYCPAARSTEPLEVSSGPQTDAAASPMLAPDCLAAICFLQSGLCLAVQSFFWQAALQ